jgi:hypothetical protein
MIDLSRHRVLLLGSLATAWLLGGIRPSSAGWLEQWFGRRVSTLTSPITLNEEFYLTSYRSPPTVRIHDIGL